jgi:hypothetical protein
MSERPLETGWLPDTPAGDTLLRQFVLNQSDLACATALAMGGRAERYDGVALADTGGPVSYLNQAVLQRPLIASDDPVLDEVERFFADSAGRILLSVWPTPDLTVRGWELAGHPAFVVRSPTPHPPAHPPGVELRAVEDQSSRATAAAVAIEGYPLDEARGAPSEVVIPLPAEGGPRYRLGLLDGVPVAVAGDFVAHGVVNLCLAATLAPARRRGVWQALVWARVDDAPDLPAVAFTSDLSRPGFERMGFLVVTRFTLWTAG